MDPLFLMSITLKAASLVTAPTIFMPVMSNQSKKIFLFPLYLAERYSQCLSNQNHSMTNIDMADIFYSLFVGYTQHVSYVLFHIKILTCTHLPQEPLLINETGINFP
jgi:hypothetical protein